MSTNLINLNSSRSLTNKNSLYSHNLNETKEETTIISPPVIFSELHLGLENTLRNLTNIYNTQIAKHLYNKPPRENIAREFARQFVELESQQLYNNSKTMFIQLLNTQEDNNTILLISMMIEHKFKNTPIITLSLFEHCMRMKIDITEILIILPDIQLLLNQLTPEIRNRIYQITDPNAIKTMQILKQIKSAQIAEQELGTENEYHEKFVNNDIDIINENLSELILTITKPSTDITALKYKLNNWWTNVVSDYKYFQLNLEITPEDEIPILNAQEITDRVKLISTLFDTIDTGFNTCIQNNSPIFWEVQDAIFQLMSYIILYLNKLNEINDKSCELTVGIRPGNNQIINLLNQDEENNMFRTKPFIDAHCSIKLIITGVTDLFVRMQHHDPS